MLFKPKTIDDAFVQAQYIDMDKEKAQLSGSMNV